jgi:adenylate cyclase
MNATAASRAHKLLRDRRFTSLAAIFIIAALAAQIAIIAVDNFMVLASADRFIQDWELSYLTPPKPVDPDIVIVAITEDTLQGFPYRSPLDRAFLDNLLVKLAAAKPKAIGVDVLFDQKTEPAKDAALRATIAGLKVPLAVVYTEDPSIVTPEQLAYLRDFVPPARRVMPNLAKDQYGTVRWIYPGKDVHGRYMPGFARALAAYAGVKTPAVQMRVVWTKPPPGETLPFLELHAQVAGLFPPETFANKIVLIGSDVTLDDRHRTPFAAMSNAGNMAGIAVHAYGLATLLHHHASPYVGWRLNFMVALLLAIAGAVLGILNFHLLPRIAALAAILAVFWAGGAGLYLYFNTMFGLLAPSLAIVASFSAMDSLTGRDARKQRQFIQGAFSRYVSPKVVEALIADPSRMSLEGERREMTYLFTDIADSTTMAEKMDSKELARVLNAYFEGVTSIVLRHEGMLDKFIGDGAFAIFNAPVDLADHSERAVRCALEIDDFCEKFRKEQAAGGLNFGLTRVGVHTGSAVIGNFGSSTRFNYTAQGDAVNTAARLEGLNKEFGTHICVSGSTKDNCSNITFRPIGSVVLKGKALAVEVWEPLHEGAMTPSQLQRYRAAFARLDEPTEDALEQFDALARELPNDPCVRHHIRRLQKGIRGVDLVMKEK